MDDLIAPVNPFPGIRSYESHEDYLFFGREKQIRELTDRLSQTRFIAVIGSSGCGKSSLIKAGLIPSLFKGKTGNFKGPWDLYTFRPGDDPLGNLSASLAENKYPAEKLHHQHEIEKILREDPSGLTSIFSKFNESSSRNSLIYIDQFEEIFRYKRNNADTDTQEKVELFIRLILSTATDAEIPVYIVLSTRSDFLDDCTEFRGLTEAINHGSYLVPRMVREEIREVITGPVNKLHGKIEESLIERLLDEVGNDPDQLPILQHALMRTWDHWKIQRVGEEAISHRHYDAVGTMREALSIHAEEIYSELHTPRTKLLTEKLFKALIDFGEENKGIRHPTCLGDLCELAEAQPEEMIAVIDKFREPGRAFLMPPYRINIDTESIIDISHESIMRVWTRLKQWYEEELQSSQLYLRLARSAQLYQEGKTGVWTNPELQLGLLWVEQNKPNAAWAVRYDPSFERASEFLQYSKKVYDLEIEKKEMIQQRNLQRTRRFSLILGLASIISILFLVIALNMMFKSEANEKIALEKEKIAQSESKTAVEKTQEAVIQKKISEQQQQIAEQQKIITEEQKDIAIQQQLIAEAQKKEAVRQRFIADNAKVQAIRSRDETEIQRKEAVTQKQIAEQEKIKATVSEQNTQRLRMIAIAKSMAIQSGKMQLNIDGTLPSLLALQAYTFITENRGNPDDPDVYAALSAVSDERKVLRGHEDEVRAIEVSKNGSLLASCSSDGSVKLWNLSQPGSSPVDCKTTKKGVSGFRCLGFSEDSQWLAGGNAGGVLMIWKTAVPAVAPLVIQAHPSPITSVSFPDHSKSLVTTGTDGVLKVWDISTANPAVIFSSKPGKKISMVIYHKKNNLLYFCSDDGTVRTLNPANPAGEGETVFTANKAITSIAISPDGNFLAAGLSSGLIQVTRLTDQAASVSDLIGHIAGITSLVFSPDGTSLASGSYDRTIRLWNFTEPGSPPILINDNDSWVFGIRYLPQEKKLISCGADKTIRFFITDSEVLAGRICQGMTRNLSSDEWNKYVGNDIPYRKTCSYVK